MAQMPAEDSERSGFAAWMASGSVVCPCPLDIGWEMFVGSRDPNMLFHSSFTFESCFTCFLAICSLEGGREEGGERRRKKTTNPNITMTTFTQDCHYFETTWKSNFYMPDRYLCSEKTLLLCCGDHLTGIYEGNQTNTCHMCSHFFDPTADSCNKSLH